MITQTQLSMADFFSDCKEIMDNSKPEFLEILETHIDIN